MKKIIAALFAVLLLTASLAMADTTDPAPVTGWGPSVIGNVGAFYLNGDYRLLQGGIGGGAAYTWKHGGNVNSAGIYMAPQSAQTNGVTSTSLAVIAYVDLFKTAAAQFGVGLGYGFWQSGSGVTVPDRNNTFMAFAVKF